MNTNPSRCNNPNNTSSDDSNNHQNNFQINHQNDTSSEESNNNQNNISSDITIEHIIEHIIDSELIIINTINEPTEPTEATDPTETIVEPIDEPTDEPIDEPIDEPFNIRYIQDIQPISIQPIDEPNNDYEDNYNNDHDYDPDNDNDYEPENDNDSYPRNYTHIENIHTSSILNNDVHNNMITTQTYPNDLSFLSNNNYTIHYDEEIFNIIQNDIIPFLHQWDDPPNIFYHNMVINMFRRDYEFIDIYNGIGVYLTFGMDLINDLEENMDHVRRSILNGYESERRRSSQIGQSLISILYGGNPILSADINQVIANQVAANQVAANQVAANQIAANQIAANQVAGHPNEIGANPNEIEANPNSMIFMQQSINGNINIQQFHQLQQNQQIQHIFNQILGIGTGVGSNMNQMDPVKLTIPKEELDKIPVVSFQSLPAEVRKINTACCICQDNFEPTDDVRYIKCNHAFHPGCVDQWFLDHSFKCPVCRSEAGVHIANL